MPNGKVCPSFAQERRKFTRVCQQRSNSWASIAMSYAPVSIPSQISHRTMTSAIDLRRTRREVGKVSLPARRTPWRSGGGKKIKSFSGRIECGRAACRAACRQRFWGCCPFPAEAFRYAATRILQHPCRQARSVPASKSGAPDEDGAEKLAAFFCSRSSLVNLRHMPRSNTSAAIRAHLPQRLWSA